MPVEADGPHLAETPELAGHRIGVVHVVDAVLYGSRSVEDVAECVYPQLTEAEVLDALAFALADRDAMADRLRRRARRKAELGTEAVDSAADVPASIRR
ncbi:MAG: DUF433 domain-containing protein [Haloarculaceae archaeon]